MDCGVSKKIAAFYQKKTPIIQRIIKFDFWSQEAGVRVSILLYKVNTFNRVSVFSVFKQLELPECSKPSQQSQHLGFQGAGRSPGDQQPAQQEDDAQTPKHQSHQVGNSLT